MRGGLSLHSESAATVPELWIRLPRDLLYRAAVIGRNMELVNIGMLSMIPTLSWACITNVRIEQKFGIVVLYRTVPQGTG